jgi:hypothetical protein
MPLPGAARPVCTPMQESSPSASALPFGIHGHSLSHGHGHGIFIWATHPEWIGTANLHALSRSHGHGVFILATSSKGSWPSFAVQRQCRVMAYLLQGPSTTGIKTTTHRTHRTHFCKVYARFSPNLIAGPQPALAESPAAVRLAQRNSLYYVTADYWVFDDQLPCHFASLTQWVTSSYQPRYAERCVGDSLSESCMHWTVTFDFKKCGLMVCHGHGHGHGIFILATHSVFRS